MISGEFYLQLKKALESDYLKKHLQANEYGEYSLLVRAIYYLISTRDFDGFYEYLEQYQCCGEFPRKYLKKALTDEEIELLIYNNFIKNGFLFHVSPSDFTNDILNNGIRTLNNKYHCNLYKKCVELNSIGTRIYQRNSNIADAVNFKLLVGLNLNKGFPVKPYLDDRFNKVYLSSNLSYILDEYGDISEFSDCFISGIKNIFQIYGKDGNGNFSGNELRAIIYDFMKCKGIVILESEIDKIVEFYETVYAEKSKDSRKTILLIPTSVVNSDDEHFSLYKDNSSNVPVDSIIRLNHQEIGNIGNINSDDIIAIECNEDKSLTLRISR